MKRTLRPDRLLREVLGVGWARKNILGRDYSLKNEVKRAILKADVMTERQIDSMADKVTDFYISKAERLQAEGIKAYRKEAINNERLMKERVEMAVTYYEVDKEAKAHAGGFYRWLPSEAKEPEPEHALLYGKVFKVGEGDKDGNMPMQRYGCRCGIEWLSDETAEKELKVMDADDDILTEEDLENSYGYDLNNISFNLWKNPTTGQERIYINGVDELKYLKAYFYKDEETGLVMYSFKSSFNYSGGFKRADDAADDEADRILMTIREIVEKKNKTDLKGLKIGMFKRLVKKEGV